MFIRCIHAWQNTSRKHSLHSWGMQGWIIGSNRYDYRRESIRWRFNPGSIRKDFTKFWGTGHCVEVNSSTTAIYFSLKSLSINHGDIVLTVSNTFIATAEAIAQTNAAIGFVDIDKTRYTMSPEKLRQFIDDQCYRKNGITIHRKTGEKSTCGYSGAFIWSGSGYGCDSGHRRRTRI